MENLAPLIQTILWVGLITGILWRFHGPIYGILIALQKRIESGSSIKAGPFEIVDQLKPQDPAKQREKAANEVQEALQVPASGTQAPSSPSTDALGLIDPSIYFQAEDLALRALQSEYGKPVNRQMTAGKDLGFDGALVINGRLSIIEVKYAANLGNITYYRNTLEKISNAIHRYGWRNVEIILAVVFESNEDIPKGSEILQTLVQGLSLPVIVRCYSFAELRVKFGVVSVDDK